MVQPRQVGIQSLPRDAARRFQTLGLLAGSVAHDFNTLLTGMLNTADLALTRVGEHGDLAIDLRNLRADAERGAALVRRILERDHPDGTCGKGRAILLDWFVRDAAPMLQRVLGGFCLTLDLQAGDALVMARDVQLDQILINLVVNARDAMTGDGRVCIATRRGEDPTMAQLIVTDTGCGIPPDAMAHIFDPFHSLRRERRGTGLGLYTVLHEVQTLGGRVEVSSQMGQGSSFALSLPLCVTPPAGVPCVARTVLFVEDDPQLLDFATRLFVLHGWNLVAAEDAGSAMAQWTDSRPPALLVTDLDMPGMNGIGLIDAMRRRFAGLPAIVTTGYADAHIQKFLDQSGVEFHPKPYRFHDLIAACERLIALHDRGVICS